MTRALRLSLLLLAAALSAACESGEPRAAALEATEPPTPALREQIEVVSHNCTSKADILGTENRAVGRVRNNSEARADITIAADFLNINQVLLDQASHTLLGLGPGEEARFDMRSDGLPGASCRVRVASASES